jgi:hypothetical protein
MKLTSAQREQVRMKFGGKCAYCGCDLPQRWHADHFEAVLRGVGSAITGLPMARMENDRIENIMPSCPPCNIDKASFSLDQWRGKLERTLEVLARNSPTYRHALRFGMAQEIRKPIKFYFEGPEAS